MLAGSRDNARGVVRRRFGLIVAGCTFAMLVAGAPAAAAAPLLITGYAGTGAPPPVNSGAPAPTGTATEGQVLTVGPGTWTNSPTLFGYQWQRCDTTGSHCVDITGATATTYTLSPDDAAHTLRVTVTASNVGGSTAHSTLPTPVVLPLPPQNTSAPVAAGTAVNLQTLTAEPGDWAKNPTRFTYQWQDCDAGGANCANIGGATAASYALRLSDVGDTVRVQVTATNAGGHATAGSDPTAVIAPVVVPWADIAPPAPVSAPVITGTAAIGATLACSTGAWSSSPVSYAYQWNRAVAPIANATAATYTVQAADQGHKLSCTVTATNSGGAIQTISAGVSIPRTSAPVCAPATGAITRSALGPLKLGATRAQARQALRSYRSSGDLIDSFCLAGGQSIRAAYATTKLASIARTHAAQVSGRVVLALTASGHYALKGVRPGMRVAAAAKHVKLGHALRIGANVWYVIPGAGANGVVEARGGVIRAVGIADKRLSTGQAAQRRLLASI
jgi:hypothetical protein